MISKKVLYSEQLLQLVLALSLLQVDPINYLEWGVSRIHSSGIGPWQLEVAQTQFSDYPYMNRKNYVPLIEDLARYDGMHNNDVTAYLLNFDNAPSFLGSATANSNNNNSSTSAVNTSSSNTAENERNNNAFSGGSNESAAAAALNLVNLIQDRFQEQGGNADDIFLQSELFASNNGDSIIDRSINHSFAPNPCECCEWLRLRAFFQNKPLPFFRCNCAATNVKVKLKFTLV